MNLSISTNTQGHFASDCTDHHRPERHGNGELLTHGEHHRFARQLQAWTSPTFTEQMIAWVDCYLERHPSGPSMSVSLLLSA